MPHRRTDAAGVPARHLLGRPPTAPGLSRLSRHRPVRPRCAVADAGVRLRPPPRGIPRRGGRAGCGGRGPHTGNGRAGLHTALRSPREEPGPRTAHVPGLHARGATAPTGGGGVRRAWTPVGSARRAALPHRGGPGPGRRHRRPFHVAADGAALRRLPPALHRARAPLRMARRGGGQCRRGRRPGGRGHRLRADGYRQATW